VVKKRADVDPQAAWFQNFVNAFYVVNQVVGSINEEASDNTVPLFYKTG
jgi:hypothetical protein